MAEIDSLDPTDANNTARFPEGMAFSAVNDGARALEGMLARWFKDTNGSLSSSGSSNAFAVTSNRTISSLTDGTRISFKANHSITGAATLNLNSLGAKDIKRFNASALASGDIISGQIVDVVYSASLDDWVMVSAAAGLVGSTFADFAENASPGVPAANTARLYAKDVFGTTRLAYVDADEVEWELRSAIQSEMEAASAFKVWVSPGFQHYHPGHPKAWAKVSSAGSLTASYGVSSVSRTGTGVYEITLSTAMSSTGYAVVATNFDTSDFATTAVEIIDASSFRVRHRDNNDDSVRDLDFSVVVFGDHS